MSKVEIQQSQLVWAYDHHKDAGVVSLYLRNFMTKRGYANGARIRADDLCGFFSDQATLDALEQETLAAIAEGKDALNRYFAQNRIKWIEADKWYDAAVAIVEALYVPADLAA